MKRVSILLLLLLFSAVSLFAEQRVKVACIGNSITFGSRIENREVNSYPAQLQSLLGEGYEVQNFGVSARTALSKGNFPYIETPQYQESLTFEPDIVFIKLGTNDSKEGNFIYVDEFESDYQAIIDSYLALDSSPRVILVTPLKCHHEEGDKAAYSISNARLVSGITPVIEKLAYKNGLEIINGYPICGTEYDPSIVPDKIHPSAAGAAMMAELFRDVILSEQDADYNIFESLEGGDEFDFYGYTGREYQSDGLSYKVVAPHRVNDSHKWVLRARFWGHQPQLDRRLLEMGYHIAYCDVADLFGSNEAVKRWDKLFAIMTKAGLSERVVLEGMSRGGLIVYNWAAKNPKKVEAIYADAPVLDLKSWPMGYASAIKEVEQMCDAYGKSVEKMANYSKNPIDQAKRIAKAKIPTIHVVGADDEVVPVADNTAKFAALLLEQGHEITIISKDGVGHHPHSLGNPKIIADFIIEAGR